MDNRSNPIQPFTPSTKATSTVEVVLLVIIIALFTWFIAIPKFSTYRAANQALKTIEEQITKAEQEGQEITKLATKLKSSDQAVKLADEVLPLNGRITKLQVLVDQLASFSGLQLSSMDIPAMEQIISAGNKEVLAEPFKQERALRTDTVTVSLSGTVDQFRNFLELLETNTRLLSISDFRITSDAQTTKYTLTIKAYAYEVK